MLLAREFVSYLSRQTVAKLPSSIIEISNPAAVTEIVHTIVVDKLSEEDRLNDEVRQILEEYTVYMSNQGISYSEMFRKTKNQMLKERKLVRASGRDTGDPMKLSRDKVNEISHMVAAALKKSRDCRLRRDVNDLRLEIVRIFSDLLQNEDKADRDARAKVRSMKKEIPEGSEEWDLLHKRYYAEELKKLGIDLAH